MNWRGIFKIDHRSLRLFRFGLGTWLVSDIFIRSTNFTAFFTEAGALPSHLVKHGNLSLFLISDSPLWAAFLLFCMAVCGMLLVFNRAPRSVSAVAFVLALSLKYRNSLVIYGADDLFRLGLIWSALLPSGPRHAGEKAFSSLASFAAMGQIFALYLCAGLWKDPKVWLMDPIATFVALNSDTYAKPITRIVLQFPELLKWATVAVFFIERAGWLLFFSPWRNAEARMAGFVIFALMHLSFGTFLHLELFPMIDIILITLVIPSKFWDYLNIEDTSRPVAEHVFDPALRGLAAVLFSMVLMVNVYTLPQLKWKPPTPVRKLTRVLAVNQAWSMFTPVPGLSDGYYRMISRMPSGAMADELNQQILENFPSKPVDPQAEQGGFRWTRYLEEVSITPREDIKEALLSYFCRRWRPDIPGAESRQISLYRFHEATLAPQVPVASFMDTLVTVQCGDPPKRIKASEPPSDPRASAR